MRSLFFISCSVFFLAACTPAIDSIEAPVEEEAKRFSTDGESLIPDKWWTAFGDAKLDSLVEKALGKNMNLISVWQQVKAAKSIRKQQSTRLLPDINANAQTAISRPEPDFAGGENTQIGLTANYEVDLWGRISANVQAENFRFRASYYDYQAAAISLSAEVSNIYFQLKTAKRQLALANQQIENNKRIIKLIRVRFGGGQIKGVDILRQQQLLEETKNRRILYQTQIQTLKNQLAVLTGTPPQNFSIEVSDSFGEIPEKPKTGLPLELIRRRPDIQREYSALLAADRDMAAAVRNKFPRMSLNLSAQARSNTYTNLFNNWAYTLGANLLAPILYWGRLRAEVDRTEAVKKQQLHQYGQSVLTAFQEVEDALIREENQKKRIQIFEKRVEMAEKVSKQLRIEFLNGFTNYLDVLVSLDDQQQLQRNLLEAKQLKYEYRIALYRSLAGSFETERENELEEKPTRESEEEPTNQ